MQYMIVETFVAGAEPVYARFRKQGRMLPDGLSYVDSWISEDLSRCYQIMSCDDPALLDKWIAKWSDILEIEVVPVISSSDAECTVSVSSPPGT